MPQLIRSRRAAVALATLFLGVVFLGVVLLQASSSVVAQTAPPPTLPDPPTDVVGSVRVSPVANTSLNWPPREVRLTFQTDVASPSPQVTLVDADGLLYPPALEITTKGKEVVFDPPSLPAGVYTVSWDGPEAGSYRFAVTAGNAGELGPTGTPSPVDPMTSPAVEGTGIGVRVLLLLSVAALTGVLVFRFRTRRVAIAIIVSTAVLGTVFALRPTGSSVESRQRCLTFSGDQRLACLADVALALHKTGGVPAALAELRSLAADPLFRPEYGEHVCHSVAHLAARVVVAREGSISKALEDADTLCSSGFLHGVLEGGAPLLETGVFAEEIKSICGTATDEAAFECAHGIGHATALRLNSRLRESTDICRGLANQPQAVQCVLGVSMLYGGWIGNMVARSPDPAQYTPPGSPTGEIGEVCLDERFTTDPDMLRVCLEGMFFYLKSGVEPIARLPRAWSDLNEVGSWCATLATSRPDLEMACFSALGSGSALRLHESPANMPGVCAAALTAEGVNACVVALVTQLRRNSSDSPEFSVYETVCAGAPAVVRAECLRTSKRLYEEALDPASP